MFQIFFGIWFICSLALPLVECIQHKVYEYKCCMQVCLMLTSSLHTVLRDWQRGGMTGPIIVLWHRQKTERGHVRKDASAMVADRSDRDRKLIWHSFPDFGDGGNVALHFPSFLFLSVIGIWSLLSLRVASCSFFSGGQIGKVNVTAVRFRFHSFSHSFIYMPRWLLIEAVIFHMKSSPLTHFTVPPPEVRKVTFCQSLREKYLPNFWTRPLYRFRRGIPEKERQLQP